MQEKFEKLVQKIDDKDLDIVYKLDYIVDFIRPEGLEELEKTKEAMDYLIAFFNKKQAGASSVSDALNCLLIDSRISTNITAMGILSHDGFRDEIKKRFYNKFFPAPPKKGDFQYIFSVAFYKKDDHIWVNAIEDEKWIKFFASLFASDEYQAKTKNHLFDELLYAAEILAIWIASEEFDENFIRLDKGFLYRDSAFIALQRDMSSFVHKIQEDNIDLSSTALDFEHIHVLIGQCKDQVKSLRKKSVKNGISIDVTYELERLEQIIKRLEDIVELIKNFDSKKFYISCMELFKEAIIKNATKNSLSEVYQQSIRIVAKSVTNNASEHGEHYITSSLKDYFKMFLTAGGAGIIIALMALIKINITQAGFSQGIETFIISMNYGLGFVFIHLCGFTVATKQPAMTASTFAEAIEKKEKNRANQKKLVKLFMQVSRSQFAAVLGNVLLALLVAFGIGYFLTQNGGSVVSSKEALYYLEGLNPYPALFFAAIAGFWLFLSGLIAGYFDNRADLLEIKERYFHHPLLRKIMDDKKREKLAEFLHEHHGAIAGNFFFGVFLGLTPYLGYLFDLPLDIRHVAFSTAFLGFSSMHLDISYAHFFVSLLFVFLIGLVNLFVSFTLALKVSLLSRESYFGSFFSFIKIFAKEVKNNPLALFYPPKENEKKETT